MTETEPHAQASGKPPRGKQARKARGQSDSGELLIAERLRRARQVRGLTLSEVASQVGLSHNFLSMVERGLTDLSLSRFVRLANFYGIPAGELISEYSTVNDPQVSAPDEGMRIDRGPGIVYRLLPNQEFGVQVVHITFEAGSAFTEALSHIGADVIWVIEGVVTLVYGEREFELSRGQCASYKGLVPHAFENRSKAPASLVGIVTIPYW